MRETVLAKGGDPKMEQVTCLKTEFLPFNSTYMYEATTADK